MEEQRDYLLAEYARIGAEVLANEASGDARTTVHLTAWALGGTALAGFLTMPEPAAALRALMTLAMLALLALGALTLLRLYARNNATDDLTDTLTRLRALLDVRGAADRALPEGWQRKDGRVGPVKGRRQLFWKGHPRAGLIEILVVINACSAGMPVVAASPDGVVPAIALAVVAFAAQVYLIQRAYRARHAERDAVHRAFAAQLRPPPLDPRAPA